MATYNWTISRLDCAPQEDGLTDVVVTAHWNCTGERAYGGELFYAQVYGTCSFTLDSTKDFIPYDSLTQDQVLSWIWNSGVDKDATQANIDTQLENQINPLTIVLPLPWSN